MKTRWWNRITDFLAYLPDDAFEKRFITFAVAAEETHLARMQDTANIVASLKQKTTAGIDDDSAGNLMMPRRVHAAHFPLVSALLRHARKELRTPCSNAALQQLPDLALQSQLGRSSDAAWL